ncbi:MAG: phosphomannomutase [Chloroflexi bacterium RBG_13_46_14]|nr:MAG: phosphomannomutase [Chloroflexi bacterium RBG_13_46_14]
MKFGTDGWRAIIARDFTYDNVRICAQAVADYLRESGITDKGLVIGYDTRFASEDFAAAAAEVVAGNDIKVYLSPSPIPTPIVSYSVIAKQTGGAIVITASHNPPAWNGIKFKTSDGAGAPGHVTQEIEKYIGQINTLDDVKSIPLTEAIRKGLIEYLDMFPIYRRHVEALLDLGGLRRSNLKIVIDPMYGTSQGYLKSLIEGGTLDITEIHNERNPLFPGLYPEPIPPHITELTEAVKRLKADVGVATDGDGDRMGIVDENGNYVPIVQVFALLALYLLEIRGEKGLIVKTVNATNMLYTLGDMHGVTVRETPVGFKYIAEIMLDKNENVLIGGEESGSFGYEKHMPERDGIFSILCFLDLMVRTEKTPSQLIDYLFSKVGPHYYDRIDIDFPESERQWIIDRVINNPPCEIQGMKVKKYDTFDGYKYTLTDDSWLLIRFSGTEPLLRIYTESTSPERVEDLLRIGRGIAGV